MSRNMRSKMTATDHTYVHSYGRFLSFDMFFNSQRHTYVILLLLSLNDENLNYKTYKVGRLTCFVDRCCEFLSKRLG